MTSNDMVAGRHNILHASLLQRATVLCEECMHIRSPVRIMLYIGLLSKFETIV